MEKLGNRWWEGLTGEELMLFINNELFPTLKSLTSLHLTLTLHLLRACLKMPTTTWSLERFYDRSNKLEEIHFDNLSDRHLYVRTDTQRSLQSAGNAGEYYTPRAVTEFIVQMVDPKLGEKVFDPACGTGGFLISSINHIMKSDVKNSRR